MTSTTAQTWLQLLDIACAKVSCRQVSFIIDQVEIAAPLFPGIEQVEPPIPWHVLFDGLPEAAHADLSPLLVRVDLDKPQQRLWLEGLIDRFGDQARLLALISPWPLQRLGDYLGQCLEARNGGGAGVLRYYDPRLFPLLFSHVLSAEQQQWLLSPALLWSWLDRDGIPRHRAGAGADAGTVDDPPPFELSDRQIDVLCCAADAAEALDRLAPVLPEGWGAEQLFRVAYGAMLEADGCVLLLPAECDAFVLERLHGTSVGRDTGGQA
ncbi:DUF4123 domain-containing protein [Pseudomonas japonica]|uniref:DUF4123 domain-containing protein n=1 Tax=Pseudomonas japonica TaxID=256466 RepID=UPI0037F1FCBE